MMDLFPQKAQRRFDYDLADWCVGGPKMDGWTRAGKGLRPRKARLLGIQHRQVDIEDVLAKNPIETEKWHLSFLQDHQDPENTLYYQEYLKPRYNPQEAQERWQLFLAMADSIRERGVLKSIWVADVSNLNLGFPWFRFDGCHRTCCAKFLGFKTVPAFVFSTKAL